MENLKTVIEGLVASGADAATIAAVLQTATAPAAPAPAAPAPVSPTWVYAVRKLGANSSAAIEAKKAAKYLREQVLAGVFAPFEKTEAGKDAVLNGFFQHCKTQGLWNVSRDGDSVSALGKSKSKREKAHGDAKAVYCAYVRILGMFRPAPKRAERMNVAAVLTALDGAKKDFFPRVKAETWEAFKSAVEADLTES